MPRGLGQLLGRCSTRLLLYAPRRHSGFSLDSCLDRQHYSFHNLLTSLTADRATPRHRKDGAGRKGYNPVASCTLSEQRRPSTATHLSMSGQALGLLSTLIAHSAIRGRSSGDDVPSIGDAPVFHNSTVNVYLLACYCRKSCRKVKGERFDVAASAPPASFSLRSTASCTAVARQGRPYAFQHSTFLLCLACTAD